MSSDDALLVAAMPHVRRWQAAPHGGKAGIVIEACRALGGISAQTFYALAGRIVGERQRKKRADAGDLSVDYADAKVISAYLMASLRKHGKQLASLKKTLQELRDNGLLRLERIIPTTGEVVQLSDTTVARALRQYGLHPEQLCRATPHGHLRSPHANWCWQMDASVCVIYYLPKGGAMIREMSEAEFYSGKPENWNRIAGQMVIRYLMTEHRWGMLRLHYVHGAESGENACDHLIRTMLRPADERGMLWGVPQFLMVDPGSAQTGNQFRRLCRRMGVKLIINKPGNPRAKGQVEQGHNLVERDFEHGLKLLGREIHGIDDLNHFAFLWQRHFNAKAIHSRHGRTRFDGWATEVSTGYLVAPPPEQVMRDLALRDPKTPTVQGDLSVQFGGKRYHVGHVPDIRIGTQVLVHRNPWREGEVVLIREDDRGDELQFPLPEMAKDEAGQYLSGAIVGEEYRAPMDTVVDTNRKAVVKLQAGEGGLKAAEKKLKAKGTVPLEGLGIDPLIRERQAELPAVDLQAQAHEMAGVPVMVLTMVRAARLIRDGLGRELTDSEFDWISQRWPEGVPENQITNLIAQFARADAGEAAPAVPAGPRIERVA